MRPSGARCGRTSRPGFHKVAKYLIIPGVHQPTAPFELCINKEAWAKVTPADQRLVEQVAKLVTYDSWIKVGDEDAKALDFYRKAGNEIIELDVEVQRQARKIGLEWAGEDREGQSLVRARAQEPGRVREVLGRRRALAHDQGLTAVRSNAPAARAAALFFAAVRRRDSMQGVVRQIER